MTAVKHIPAVTEQTALSESLEDYLEAIGHIESEKQVVRSKDIARRLHVSPPSVTAALQNLAGRGLVNYQPYGLVTLTPQGRRVAHDVIRRHEGLQRFFEDLLCIEAAEADRLACSMEHAMPAYVTDRLLQFLDFVFDSPHGGLVWSPDSGFGLRDTGAAGTPEQAR
jgi:DtxR family Mn-dependent transcriptional regulator